MTEITDAMLIEKYIERRDQIADATKKYKEKIQPWKDDMELIQNAFLDRFNERGSRNTTCEGLGTAYTTRRMDAKIVDRTKFLEYCLANWTTFGPELMNLKAHSEPIWQIIGPKEDQPPPPGVELTFSTSVTVRKG